MFSPDGSHILTISHERVAHLWNASSGELLYSFRHQAEVNCGAFSKDGRMVATCGDDALTKFWDMASGKELTPPIVRWHSVDFLAFSPDGGRLVTASDKTIELWDITTRQPLLRPFVHERRVVRADFSPDGRWLAILSEGNRVHLWDTDTAELLAPSFIHDTPRRPVLFSSDGHLLLTLQHDLNLGREETAVVWSLATQDAPRLKVPPITSFRKRPARSADGRFEADVSGYAVRTIVVASGRPLAKPLMQNVPFRQACFNHDDSLLITESVGARGQLWDTPNGEPLTPLWPIDYDTNAQAVSRADLAHDMRPAKELLSLAELLCGNRIDETGGFRALDTDALIERWSALKRVNADASADSVAYVREWHERQAAYCEQAWNWWSARFHLSWLLSMHPGDPILEKRLAYAQLALENADRKAAGYAARRFSVIPPRNPAAGSGTIDLSEFYNFSNRVGDNSMASLPSGLQTFAGTPFDVRGVVQLADWPQVGASNSFPTEVRNINVHRTCHRLHFLHATASQSPTEDEQVSTYVVHYADQRSQCITNLYGQDLQSWWTTQHEPLKAASAALVWIGSNRQTEFGNSESVRMFKRTWDNPWPDVEVTTIDFLPNGKRVGPFLVALTAE
jgi:hypothetical protein